MSEVFLISGHGAGDPGATSVIDGVAYREAVEAEALVKKIAESLKAYNCVVNCYPFERDAYKDCLAGAFSVPGNPALAVEIHFNAFKADAGDGKAKGCEAYYAAVADEDVSDKLAIAVCKASDLPKRETQYGNFAVIRRLAAAGVPAVLLEVCFLDDGDDMRRYLLRRDAIAEKLAEEIAMIIGAGKRQSTADGCDDWAADACRWAVEQGLFRGDGESMRWREPLTRQEMAVVLQRLAGNAT